MPATALYYIICVEGWVVLECVSNDSLANVDIWIEASVSRLGLRAWDEPGSANKLLTGVWRSGVDGGKRIGGNRMRVSGKSYIYVRLRLAEGKEGRCKVNTVR